MSSFFTTPHVATTALVRIWCLIHPREFGANLFEQGLRSVLDALCEVGSTPEKRRTATSMAPSVSGRRSESGNHLGEVVQLREFWLQLIVFN